MKDEHYSVRGRGGRKMINGCAQPTKLFPEVEVGKRQLPTDLLSRALPRKQKTEESSLFYAVFWAVVIFQLQLPGKASIIEEYLNPERICLERDFMPLFLLSEHHLVGGWRVRRRRRTWVLDN